MDWLNTLIERFTDLFRWWVVLAPWERGLRVRMGKHVVEFGAGMHLRIPIIDRFYVQSVRLRTIDVRAQTVTSLDGRTLTVSGVVQYSIADLRTLYDTLHYPDDTIVDVVAGHVAQYVSQREHKDITPDGLRDYVNGLVDLGGYGLDGGSYRVTDFAFVRTYRFITADRYRHLMEPVSTDTYEA